jgi:ABC-2 type transport system ATP-binding protein
MLDVSKLSRSYGNFLAVDNVSFTIKSGEIVGLLGHNGAGKTTIMKMLSGFLEPDQGRIVLDGIDMATNAKEAQRLLGYLPENLPVYPEMSVADYLDYAADLKGLKGDIKTAEIRRAVKATELAAKLLAPIATLSRGYKQRVGVAQAILGKPRVLILDEPTNGLDPTQTEHMRALIRDIAKHATVILSTHIMQEVDALCDRVLIINAGRLVINAALAELKQAQQLELSTSLPLPRLQGLLAGIADITGCNPNSTAVSSNSQWQHYQLDLKTGHNIDDTAAALAQAVISAGGRIAALQPVVRNLETLFREVSSGHATTATHKEERPYAA